MNTVERIKLDNGYFIDLTTFPTYYEAYLGRERCPVRLQLGETRKDQFDKDFFTNIVLVQAEEEMESLDKLIDFYASNQPPITGEIVYDSRPNSKSMVVGA
jgi:hypothetical protein